MDKAAIFLLLTYLVVIILRFVLDQMGDSNMHVSMLIESLNPIASITSYALLYFFVFEMMFIVATVSS